jgi:pyruvate carboxylase subunit B
MRLVATLGGQARRVEITGREGRYHVVVDGHGWDVDARHVVGGRFSLLVDGKSYVADVAAQGAVSMVDVGGETYRIQVEDETRYIIRTRGGAAAGAEGQTLTAPLPGKVTHVAVRVGDRVEPGSTLLVIEAMKMENEFKAVVAGTVTEVRAHAGQAVNPGDVLVVVQ